MNPHPKPKRRALHNSEVQSAKLMLECGKSKSAIAKALGVCERTIRNALAGRGAYATEK